MPVEPVLTLIAVAVAVNLGVMFFLLVPPLFGRRSPLVGNSHDDGDPGDRATAETIATVGEAQPFLGESGVAPGAFDRVVRIVSWIFILASASLVAVTGLWSENHPAIFILLALAGLLVVIVHDLVPTRALGQAKLVLEASVALTFAAILVVLTGREASPFFYVVPLILGGSALVARPRVALTLTAFATFAYLMAVATGPNGLALPALTIATVGIQLTAMYLLVYVAAVVAREQRRARDAAIRLSTIDSLTGLFNRSFFFAAVDREIARSTRSGRGFCLLMMDLDELKAINDHFGHHEGDRILRGIGDVIRIGVRRIDIACRYGGDEFVVLLPETDPTGAHVLAEKVRIGVAALGGPGSLAQPTLSIGVVGHPDDGRTADELMISADQAMYAAKRAGKDRVMGLPVGTGGRRGQSV